VMLRDAFAAGVWCRCAVVGVSCMSNVHVPPCVPGVQQDAAPGSAMLALPRACSVPGAVSCMHHAPGLQPAGMRRLPLPHPLPMS
jgi:hypothetical protein